MQIAQIIEDWPGVKKRWEAWWQGELYDRVLIRVTAPRDGVTPVWEQVDPVTQWTDAGYMVRRTLEELRTTYYGGEALPWCWNPISAGHALYFGGRPHFEPDTMWVEPAPSGPDGYPMLDVWHESTAWRWVREGVEAFARESRGRFFVLPFWGNHAGDILAAVRGFDRFYLDVADNPAWVRSAVKRMSDILMQVHEELMWRARPVAVGVEGTLNYNGCWSPKRTLSFDCDVSCNVSPQAFRELFLPPLVESMARVDHRIYHLDGPRALSHLDTLLGLPELHAIQWVPGAGQEEVAQWLPMLRRIQAARKGVHVHCQPDEVDLVLRELKPEGLCLVTRCNTEAEARRLVDHVGQWPRRRTR